METTVFTKSPLRRRNEKLKERLAKNRSLVKEKSRKAGELKKEVAQLRRRVDELETGTVRETCQWCSADVRMEWDTDRMGYSAYCPVCGSRLMLCNECFKKNGDSECDYDFLTGNCKFSKGGEKD